MSYHHSQSPHLHLRETVERNKPGFPGGLTRYYISDGRDETSFTRLREDFFCRGSLNTGDAVKRCGNILRKMGMSQSTLNVMTAAAENQGNVDTVCIGNDFYLTFGMLQWPVGSGSDPGPLAALLLQVKEADPVMFNDYFGRHGLGVQPVHSQAGYLSLNGEVLKLPRQKNRLRSLEWGFLFWKSCREPVIQAMQIQHALCHIDCFYRSRRCAANGHPIAALITSEYGLALVLDHHIVRPGHVKPCLEEALKQVKGGEPDLWGTDEEMRLIETYLDIRAEYGTYPMNEAKKRAEMTKKYLDDGTISNERGSFIYGIRN